MWSGVFVLCSKACHETDVLSSNLTSIAGQMLTYEGLTLQTLYDSRLAVGFPKLDF